VASYAVRVLPVAAAEAETARAWYHGRNPAVAEAFLIELDAAIQSIAEAPTRWPRVYTRFRRYLLHKFPFSIVYLEHRGLIEIIAVAHHRRKPGYWVLR
jgi:toxin ParE1/3/4